jgi:hypothetical protein
MLLAYRSEGFIGTSNTELFAGNNLAMNHDMSPVKGITLDGPPATHMVVSLDGDYELVFHVHAESKAFFGISLDPVVNITFKVRVNDTDVPASGSPKYYLTLSLERYDDTATAPFRYGTMVGHWLGTLHAGDKVSVYIDQVDFLTTFTDWRPYLPASDMSFYMELSRIGDASS